MTREEAIKIIDCYDIGFYDLSGEKIPADKLADAFDMAIEALSAEDDDLIIKGAKGIQDGVYNIKDGKLFKYKANGGTVRTYPIVPSAEAVQVVRCKDCKHHHECCRGTIPLNPDGYCSDGSRKEQNNE